MPELYDDRRQEPRFPAPGAARLQHDGREFDAVLLDLSLNGARLERPAGFTAAPGSRGRLRIEVAGASAFDAEVLFVRAEDERVAVEFYDMPPADFAVLTSLIDRFRRSRGSPA